jgi:hypothetical protein
MLSTYSVKIKHYNKIFAETVSVYRNAVNYLIDICLSEWADISFIKGNQAQMMYVESLCHKTKENPAPKYDFDNKFYKMPSYIRRASIYEAIGKVSSYKSNLQCWQNKPVGKSPTLNGCVYIYPSLYRAGMYNQTGDYSAQVKIFRNNTGNWLSVDLRKSDIDYIYHKCCARKMCAPTLQKRGKEWFLDFPFQEETTLVETNNLVVGVDLGLNSACTCCVMDSKGTVYGRHFLNLPSEKDRLNHSINRIKKAQQYGNSKTPRLWAKAKGINDDIAVKTANFIIDVALMYHAETIVFEHLNLTGKKHGSKKQKLHMWKAQYVQSMVTNKAHRLRMHTSHICAWGNSKLAYDGSGTVLRGRDADMPTYSLCKFQNGKIYNCDLNAAYNIAARYYIREIFKSCSETDRLDILAKVPRCSKRSTCTLADLISLNAVLAA